MTRRRRIVLGVYGAASAFIFVWVPWRGGPTVRGATTEPMGYGFVWSGPRRPAAYIEYDKRMADTERADAKYNSDPNSAYSISSPRPREPEGYSAYPYKLATSTIDYERVVLEAGALSGLLLVGWTLIDRKELKQHEPG